MSSLLSPPVAPPVAPEPRESGRYAETYPRVAGGHVSSVMGTPNGTPGVDAMGGPDRSHADVMGRVDGGLRIDVMGGADGGSSVDAMGVSDPRFFDALFTG